MDDKYRSRKFIIAILSLVSGTVALYTGFMTDVIYVGLVGTVLGLYSGANVLEKKSD